jgi:hypothetical protein
MTELSLVTYCTSTKNMAPSAKASKVKVVVIELFGGVLPATLALHQCDVESVTYFSEIANDPLELVEARWPSAIHLGDIRSLEKKTLDDIVARHPGALFWITGEFLAKTCPC